MAVRKIDYCKAIVPARAGRAAEMLGALRDEGVSLLAFTGFPIGGGKAQIDLVARRIGDVRRVARKYGWRLGPTKRGFLVQGRDAVGAVHRHLAKLAKQDINVIAADALAAGGGRFAMILWVAPGDYARAGRALGAR
jgi:hypothetical protein